MKKKSKSTYEKFIEDKHQKSILDREYRELVKSELSLALMKMDDQKAPIPGKKAKNTGSTMVHRIRKAQYLEEYKIQLSFDDQSVKIVDLEKMLKNAKNMLLPLKDVDYFKQVKCDGATIVWPNGVDLCPDVLYSMGKNVKKPIRKSNVVSSDRRRKLKV